MSAEEEAGTKPLHEDEISEEFDPWALPELQDLGPKWSGTISYYCLLSFCDLFQCGKISRVLQEGGFQIVDQL